MTNMRRCCTRWSAHAVWTMWNRKNGCVTSLSISRTGRQTGYAICCPRKLLWPLSKYQYGFGEQLKLQLRDPMMFAEDTENRRPWKGHWGTGVWQWAALLSSSVTAWTVTSEKRHLHKILNRFFGGSGVKHLINCATKKLVQCRLPSLVNPVIARITGLCSFN